MTNYDKCPPPQKKKEKYDNIIKDSVGDVDV